MFGACGLRLRALRVHFALREVLDPWLNASSDTKFWGAVGILASLAACFSVFAIYRAVRPPPTPLGSRKRIPSWLSNPFSSMPEPRDAPRGGSSFGIVLGVAIRDHLARSPSPASTPATWASGVKLAGSSRGVQDIPVVTGWVFYNPLTEQIVEFPTSVQNVVWTAGRARGPHVDESITFSSQEGVNINADIGLSFHIEPTLAPHLYLRFRKHDLMLLADGYVRNAVREAFNVVASQMAVQDIYGAGKGKLVADVTAKRLRDVLGKDGFIIDQLTINGALRLPENVAHGHQPRHGGDAKRDPGREPGAPGEGRSRAGDHAGARGGRGRAPESARRRRRGAHPRTSRCASERDHPSIDEWFGAPIPGY